MIPTRIQRCRIKGWKIPENSVAITRGTKWGNPFKVGESLAAVPIRVSNHWDLTEEQIEGGVITQAIAVSLYRTWLHWHYTGSIIMEEAKQQLKDKNLACFCKIGDPCHGDILLEISNS